MKIRDLMIEDVATCRNDTNLAAAGALMWENDLGFLPIVDDVQKLVGVLTDRDICIALCTRNVRSSDLTAGEVATTQILSCGPNENVRTVLKIMREGKIHRLPVVNETGVLKGIVSIDDVLMYADRRDGRVNLGLTSDDVLETLQAISAHHLSRPLVVSRVLDS